MKSHRAALQKAEAQFETYRSIGATKPSRAERDFEKAIKEINAINKSKS